MVAFHNTVRGTDVRHWWDNGNDLIAFGRGTAGYLVINDEGTATGGRSWQTSLPPGRYCDVVHGDFTNGTCTGPTYTVGANGWFTAEVPAHDALALHTAARLS
jgi:alpha-amylase